VAIISYALWQRVFARDPNVVNRQVVLDGKAATIVGVMPSGSEYPSKTEVWTPSHFDAAKWTYRGEGTRFVNVLGRLKQDVSLPSARADLKSIGERWRTEHPDSDGHWQFGSESLRDYLYGGLRPALLILAAASGVLLLIACINVANLLLSRGSARAQEVSLRRALGAFPEPDSRSVCYRKHAASTAGRGNRFAGNVRLVAFPGGKSARPPGARRNSNQLANSRLHILCFGSDRYFVWFCSGLQARRRDLNTNLKRSDTRMEGAAGNRVRTAFISVEVGLSLILVVGASLLAESLWNLLNSPLGFQPDHVLTFKLELPWNGNAIAIQTFFADLERGIESLPGAIAVGQISALPTVDWHLRSNFDVDWKPRTEQGDAVNAEDRAIGGDYLKAMGIPLLAGRDFTKADASSKQPRAFVNEQFGRQYLPDGNLIGGI
jgi:putative ABC transport system permease protein